MTIERIVPGDRRIRLALVGCGRISRNHFESIARLPELELVAVCDVVPERARAAGEEQGFSGDRAVHGVGSGDRRSRPDDDVQRRMEFSHGV